ncbi:MAG: pilus assembly protein [Chloroflexi bacterium]|nr:pilus assembly protein [Chloroflexota bacterium]
MVASIFFLMVFFVIELGLVFAAQNGLVDSVRNAARRAATYRINEQSFDSTVWNQICTTIAEELDTQLGDDRTGIVGFNQVNRTRVIAYEWQESSVSGKYFLVASVSATYHNPLHVPIVSAILDASDGAVDGGLRLSASEKMRVENPALEYASSPTTPPTCP